MSSNYGLFLDGLPIFLGNETPFTFIRKINLNDINESFAKFAPTMPNPVVANNYCAIFLGGLDDVFQVFAEYKSIPQLGLLWEGGGFGALGGGISSGGLPGIANVIYGSGETDNWLQVTSNGWYLCVYQPYKKSGQYHGSPNAALTDFYVYKLAKGSLPATNKYGLNIYGADGALKYHSGWDMLRIKPLIIKSVPDIMIQSANSARSIPALTIKSDSSDYRNGKSFEHADAMAKHGKRVFVGRDKIVNIGTCFSARGLNTDIRGFGNVYYSPYIADGYLGWSISFFDSGILHPRDADFQENGICYLFNNTMTPINPLMVIDKPV